MIFKTITSQQYKQLLSYEKVHHKVFMVLHHFFKHNLDVMFLKFDNDLIEKMLMLLVQGMEDSPFDISKECCSCINVFNEYVYNKLRN